MADPTTNQKRGVVTKRGEDMSTLMFGKVQPQALPLEEAVLGALMLDKNALTSVMDTLRPDSFYHDAHQLIYKSILGLFSTSKPIDLLTVTEELRKNGDLEKVGGPFYLVELTNRVASAANIEYHARIIVQKHIQRELITVSTKVIKDAYEDTTDVFDLLDSAEQGLFNITEHNLKRGAESMEMLLSKAYKKLGELYENKDNNEGLTGVPSGFEKMDAVTSGWQNSDLIIVAARPGMGKTSFTLALAKNAAVDYNIPVAIFSLEMSNQQIVLRLLSLESEIDNKKLRTGQLEAYEWELLTQNIDKLSKAPIYIDDTPAINIFELRAKCRRLKMQNDIQLVIIDYLQLMSGGDDNKKGNREQEISHISRNLKALAKELNVPVIALSQLSRQTEMRGGDKRPQLSDLRESGAIEQDADIVSFIYRPEYYGLMEDELGNSQKGKAEIIIAKHRNGALETVNLRFISKFAKFADLDDDFFGEGLDSNLSPSQNIITRSSKMNEANDIPF